RDPPCGADPRSGPAGAWPALGRNDAAGRPPPPVRSTWDHPYRERRRDQGGHDESAAADGFQFHSLSTFDWQIVGWFNNKFKVAPKPEARWLRRGFFPVRRARRIQLRLRC